MKKDEPAARAARLAPELAEERAAGHRGGHAAPGSGPAGVDPGSRRARRGRRAGGSRRSARAATVGSWVTSTRVAPDVGAQLGEHVEDAVAGGAVEVAGRLVGEEDRRPRREGAGERDALLLAAGELGRVVVAALAEADAASSARARSSGRARAGELERQQDVLERGQVRRAAGRTGRRSRSSAARSRASASSERSWIAGRRSAPRRSVGRSSPATRPSSVDLPLPEGPEDGDELAGRDGEIDRVENGQQPLARGQALGQLAELDGGVGSSHRCGSGAG